MLKILGVCELGEYYTGAIGNAEKIVSLTKDFQWFTSDECKKIRGIETEPKQGTMSEIFN